MKILCVFGRHAYGDPARGPAYEFVHFLPALQRLGHETLHFESFDRSAWDGFAALNRALVRTVVERQPEVVLFVLMGYEVWTETLDLLRAATGARLLNWSTDDSWKYEQFSRFVAPHFDLYVTTDAAAATKAAAAGLDQVVRSQWAASGAALAPPKPARDCGLTVSFVGAAYGNRPRWVAALARAGIEVACFGHGWPQGPIAAERVAQVQRDSVISLNFADSPRLASLGRRHSAQIKARTFEVPGAGGFLLTEAVDGLAEWLEPGRELATFASEAELVAQVRRYLSDPAARDAVAARGHARVAAEHTYEARFRTLLARAVAGPPRRATLRAAQAEERMQALAARHAAGPGLRLLGRALAAPLRWSLGARRGPRAARRLLFECSWRVAGAHTYTAAGWPGRLFYAES